MRMDHLERYGENAKKMRNPAGRPRAICSLPSVPLAEFQHALTNAVSFGSSDKG